jgi:succinate-semialdehyde dehydrogenase / glutarate-semialdehyde dehydrogenase
VCATRILVQERVYDAFTKRLAETAGAMKVADGFEPTVLTDVTTDMAITEEETLGPVAPLYRFKSETDAVKMARDTPTLPSPASAGLSGE